MLKELLKVLIDFLRFLVLVTFLYNTGEHGELNRDHWEIGKLCSSCKFTLENCICKLYLVYFIMQIALWIFNLVNCHLQSCSEFQNRQENSFFVLFCHISIFKVPLVVTKKIFFRLGPSLNPMDVKGERGVGKKPQH